MHIFYDDDLYETVVHSRPCTACVDGKCTHRGQCNGSFGVGSKLRDPAEVNRIKAERQRKIEDGILAQAAEIHARRAS